MTGLMSGKRGLIMGLANDKSLAWGLAKRLGEHHAEYLQEQIVRGGLLLWVRTRDPASEKRAIEILKKHSADKVHLHMLPLKAEAA